MKVREIKISYSRGNKKEVKVTKSSDVYKVVIEHWDKDLIELQEEMKVVLLNRANIVLGVFELSKGGTTGTVVDVKLILSVALKCNANSIIMCHYDVLLLNLSMYAGRSYLKGLAINLMMLEWSKFSSV